MAQQPMFQFTPHPGYGAQIPIVYPQLPAYAAQPAQNPYVQPPPTVHFATTPIPFSAASPVYPASQASSPAWQRRGGLYSHRNCRNGRSRRSRRNAGSRRSRRNGRSRHNRRH